MEEEPRYLRRQKPVEFKRRKFEKKGWRAYFRVAVIVAEVAAGACVIYGIAHFLLSAPEMALAHPYQIDLSGNQYVMRSSILKIFSADRGRSVLRVPLEERRRQIESLPWIERAIVRRALPNRIQVEIVEHTPVAFLRQGTDLQLVDADGVILDLPLEGDFHFPVVTGITSAMPREERAERMQLYVQFLKDIDQARAGSSNFVSEMDLSDASDLQATLVGLPGLAPTGPAVGSAGGSNAAQHANETVLIRFGDSDFENKFRILLNNIAQWAVTAGPIQSVDLRFKREVVVNPETSAKAAQAQSQPVAAKLSRPARRVRRRKALGR